MGANGVSSDTIDFLFENQRGPQPASTLVRRQLLHLIHPFPGELRLGPAEMPVRGGLPVDGPPQVEAFDDAK